MELSPLEIRSQKFSKKIKGYDVTEVDNFLEIVAKDLEKLYGEYYSLKEELVKKNQEITDYKEKDKSISEAILMVQSVSNDIKKTALIEAEAIKKAAAAESKDILKSANEKYLDIANNIDDLLNERIIIINSIKNLLRTNIELVNREADKKIEMPSYFEQIKINRSAADNYGSGNNDSGKNYGNAGSGEKKENQPAGGGDLADFLKKEERSQEINQIDGDPADGGPGEKDMEDLLGDINKFTF